MPKSLSILTTGIAALAFTSFAYAQRAPVIDPPEPAEIAGHVAKAKEIAGTNPLLSKMAAEGYWCMTPSHASALVGKYTSKPMTDPVPAVQYFDNLYLFGTGFVGMFVLKTSDGLIAWDALNNSAEMETIFEPGMKKFGLNPADIKLMIVTHGHYDHFGGAKYMQDKYKTPVALSASDWDLMAAAPARPDGTVPPKKDRVLIDGQKVTVGDTTVQVVITPGHTPGTVSSIVPVRDNGTTRLMAMWGGTAFPSTTAAVTNMRDSALKFRDAAKAAGAVGILNTHEFFYDLTARKNAQGSSPNNPLVIGAEATQKTMEIKAECLTGQIAWSKAMGK